MCNSWEGEVDIMLIFIFNGYLDVSVVIHWAIPKLEDRSVNLYSWANSFGN